jgi:hypothetical protein
MKQPFKAEGDNLKDLRDVLSKVIDRNLVLEQRLVERAREESELPFEVTAATLAEALRKTEEAMDDVADGGARFGVSELQVSFKGFVNRKDGTFVLQLPRKENLPPPELLSTVTMNIVKMPVASPSASDTLALALEGMQAAFGRWERSVGLEEAQSVVAYATHLLSTRDAWREKDWVDTTKQLNEALRRFVAALKRKGPPQLPSELSITASDLQTMVEALTSFEALSPGNLQRFASAVEHVNEALNRLCAIGVSKSLSKDSHSGTRQNRLR